MAEDGLVAEMQLDSTTSVQEAREDPVTAVYASLCVKQKAGRSTAWGHLEPVLIQHPTTGEPLECKLRCKHCSVLFSARNPSRTVGDHLKACKKYVGPLPVKQPRPGGGPAAAAPSTPATPQPPASLPPELLPPGSSIMGAAAALPPRTSAAAAVATSSAAFYQPDPQQREAPLELRRGALLLVDTQNYNCHPNGALGSRMQGEKHYWERVSAALPLWADLVAAARSVGLEVIYTVIQSLTRDGRDRGLDYKISGFHVPPRSWDALVLDGVRPAEDEIVLAKTSSSVFGSTNIAYLLRNMGVQQLAICGAVTDQCVEHAVRDAADANFSVTMVTDACVTLSRQRHDASVAAVAGYCRQRTAAQVAAEIRELRPLGPPGGGG